jgi:osmotically-inducible protein OsmY
MPRTDEKNPKSYDDIVRQTVVDPDSSARPTRGQEQQAREGFRALDGDEAALQSRVEQALARTSAAAGVTIEVARELVTLRGRVADAADLRTIEDVVAAVPGVDTVHNQIVVGS